MRPCYYAKRNTSTVTAPQCTLRNHHCQLIDAAHDLSRHFVTRRVTVVGKRMKLPKAIFQTVMYRQIERQFPDTQAIDLMP
jgi:hypothetical protein